MGRITVVQLSRLGDLVQTLPLLKRLKEEDGGAHICLVSLEEFREVVRDLPFVDQVISFSASDVVRLHQEDSATSRTAIELMERMKSPFQPDLVVNVTHDVVGSWICEAAKGKRMVGRIPGQDGELRFAGDWAKYLVALSQNRIQNLFNLVDIYIGMGEVNHRPTGDYVYVSPARSSQAVELLKAAGYNGKGRLVAFQMGANRLHRAWPPECFARLCEELTGYGDVEIVLLGTEKERALVHRFERATAARYIDLVGKTSLTDLAAVLKGCEVLVSNDTGTVHMAVAVGTRVLGLYFSSAYYSETAPYGAGNMIIQAEYPCSPCQEKDVCDQTPCREAITAEAVCQVTRAMLEGHVPFDGTYHPHVNVYESEFLSNGTLVYVPVSTSRLSERYLTGLLNRLMWESILGVEHDQAFVERMVSRAAPGVRIPEMAGAYITGLSVLREKYLEGIESAQSIVAEFMGTTPDGRKIMSAASRLGNIEMDISKIDLLPGITKDFHQMEMMDSSEAHYPGLAVQHARKYRKLLGFTEDALEELAQVVG